MFNYELQKLLWHSIPFQTVILMGSLTLAGGSPSIGVIAQAAPKRGTKASPAHQKAMAKSRVSSPQFREIAAQLNRALDDARIEVSLIPFANNQVVARLDGTLRNPAEVRAALQTARLFSPRLVADVFSALSWEKGAPARQSGFYTVSNRPLSSPAGIETELKAALDDPRITVQAVGLGNNRWLVRLSGSVPTAEERDGVLESVRAFVPARIDRIASSLRVDAKAPAIEDARAKANAEANGTAKPPPPKIPVVDMVWPLTFGPEALNDADGGKLTGNRYEIAGLVSALNTAYKTKKEDVDIVQATRHALLIKGPADTVYNIRRQLVQLDAPGPQVQLDLWAVQLSGQDKATQAQQQKLEERLRAKQQLMKEIPFLLEWALSSQAEAQWFNPDPLIAGQVYRNAKPAELQAIIAQLDKLKKAGFDLNPARRLTLPEMLIFLSIPDEAHKSQLFDTLDKGALKLFQETNANGVSGQSSIPGTRPFSRLRRAYRFDTPERAPVRAGISEFLDAVQIFQSNPSYEEIRGSIATEKNKYASAKARVSVGDEQKARQQLDKLGNNPENLARQAAVVDGFFKIATDALAADLQEMILDPLVAQLKAENASIKSTGGVSLVGRTRLVVTSGLQSSLKPTYQSGVNTSVPAPLDATELLQSALPAPLASGTPGGSARLLDNLPQAQAILLAGALAKPVVPSYTTVAPGVGITVRPTVFGDGATARLQIEASFGVESTRPDASKDGNTWQPQPVDTVKSHTVATDATIQALDLFNISSFGLVTRHPRGPGYVPVLGRLPLIGPAFQWRRKDTQIDHNSLILVNTVILPRALDVVRYYSSSTSP